MKYLTLSADYLEPSLHDEAEGHIAIERARLPADLVARIVAWNVDYQVVVPLELEQRRSVAADIDELDARGLMLAAEIERALDESKVSYYSEGWLRHL